MDNQTVEIIAVVISFLMLYWVVRGLIQIFQRNNSILVILYIIILFPIAFVHLFFLGVFGDSKKKRIIKKAKEQAQFDKLVKEEKENI